MKTNKFLLFFLLFISLFATLSASAQVADPTITDNTATISFPEEATFSLSLAEQGDWKSAVLYYEVNRFSCVNVNTQVPVEIVNGKAEWTWVMSRSSNPPPGTELRWSWELTDDSGNLFRTQEQTVTLSDDRFDWQTISGDGVVLHWYRGDDVGPLLLDAAIAGLDRLETQMGITLEEDVDMWIYGNTIDMRDAVLFVQEWAGGLAFTDYNTILIGVEPRYADTWGVDTVPHELAHLVIGQFGRSCVGGSRPTWLEEGLAMVAQGEPESNVLSDIRNGIEDNTFEPLRSLNGSFPAHGSEATMAYSQSYSVVNYLLDTYGQEKMAELIQTLAKGENYDEATLAIYGVSIDGLEADWRASIGAEERVVPPTVTPVTVTMIETAVPLEVAQSLPTPPSAAATAAPISVSSPPETQNPPQTFCGGLAFAPLFLIGLAFVNRRRVTV